MMRVRADANCGVGTRRPRIWGVNVLRTQEMAAERSCDLSVAIGRMAVRDAESVLLRLHLSGE